MSLETFSEQRPASPAGLSELAPAKINLALHVVGQRADGFHLLESLVTFADMGDRLSFSPAAQDAFTVSGPFAAALSTGVETDNLVLRARDLLRDHLCRKGHAAPPVAIHLAKNLPVAAGIGGGSADAAATLRGLIRMWSVEVDETELATLALTLGADVPMCLRGEPLLATGIGEAIVPVAGLPALPLVLGNPLVGVATPEIFRRLSKKENPPFGSIAAQSWIPLLQSLRNDLEPPARSMVPEISAISAMIAAEGALLTRMSGSGATCFGIFPSAALAQTAATNLRRRKPEWYFQAVKTVGHHAGETR